MSSLKKAVDQRDKALTCLNEVMNVSCALLSSREGPRPISCTISTAWSRLQLQDVLVATCLLENSSSFSLDRGWALCIQVLRSSRALDLDSAGSAVTYTIPVDQLGPGWQVMKGIPSHVFPTAFSSCPSAPLSQDLSLAKTHGAWLQGLMKLRLLMSHCKNSLRDTVIGNRWICSDLERGTIQE